MMKLYNAEIFCCHGCMVEPDTTVIFISTLVRKGVPSQPSWATPLENCFRRPCLREIGGTVQSASSIASESQTVAL